MRSIDRYQWYVERHPALLMIYTDLDVSLLDGGKTGLTAITAGLMFFIAIFFAPIFASIPSYATGGALVVVSNVLPLYLLSRDVK